MILNVLLVSLVGLAAAFFDEELHTKYLTMSRSDFVEYFNKQNFSWKMTQYDDFDNRKYTACAHIDPETLNSLPLHTETLEDLPVSFDSRDKWSQCSSISAIYDQSYCGSCWTFGTASTASDRTCIHKDIHVRLAEQDFACMKPHVCDGGNPAKAFDYWKNYGLVTQDCKPYDLIDLYNSKCVQECVNSNRNYSQDKHFGADIYRVSNISDQIKAELVKNGPIQATFNAYEDFQHYETGIYVHKFGKLVAGHSVRIVGYGVDSGVDYWLVANSWGTPWGTDGWFKIKSYQKLLEFEEGLVTGLPKN